MSEIATDTEGRELLKLFVRMMDDKLLFLNCGSVSDARLLIKGICKTALTIRKPTNYAQGYGMQETGKRVINKKKYNTFGCIDSKRNIWGNVACKLHRDAEKCMAYKTCIPCKNFIPEKVPDFTRKMQEEINLIKENA